MSFGGEKEAERLSRYGRPQLKPDQCPECWHAHLDYDDEACVSCGCDFVTRKVIPQGTYYTEDHP